MDVELREREVDAVTRKYCFSALYMSLSRLLLRTNQSGMYSGASYTD